MKRLFLYLISIIPLLVASGFLLVEGLIGLDEGTIGRFLAEARSSAEMNPEWAFGVGLGFLFVELILINNLLRGWPVKDITELRQGVAYTALWQKLDGNRLDVLLLEVDTGWKRLFSMEASTFSTTNFPNRFVLNRSGLSYKIREVGPELLDKKEVATV